jgi:hypothetical protein
MFDAMRSRLVILSAILAVAAVVPALAATKHGITPTAPKAGATVEAGTRPILKGRVRGAGRMWVIVSSSRERNADGLIGLRDNGKATKDLELLQKAKRDGRAFSAKPKYFDYPQSWLNRPGTYYWQAHRINCGEAGKDCYQEGPVVKFRVH